MPVDITTYVVFAIIAALGGGAFGAAVGALPAFIFAGFLTIAGAIQMTFGGTPTLFVAAFGPLFGPPCRLRRRVCCSRIRCEETS